LSTTSTSFTNEIVRAFINADVLPEIDFVILN